MTPLWFWQESYALDDLPALIAWMERKQSALGWHGKIEGVCRNVTYDWIFN